MNPLSTNIAHKLNNQSFQRSRGNSFASSKRKSVLVDNVHQMKQEQRDFNDRIEDNHLRKQKISELLNEFNEGISAIEHPSPNKSSRARLIQETIALAEKLLGYLNIDISLVTAHTSDSAIEIDPIKDNENLIHALKYLIPRLSSFPYTFLSQLKIRNLQFCEDIRQVNPNHATIYRQKLINGLFPVGRLRTDDKIMKHLCRVFMYNMYKNVPEFGDDWKMYIDSVGNSERAVYEDLAEVFYAVLRVNEGRKPPSNPELEIKVKELRKRLKEFDPAGINYDWRVYEKRDNRNDTENSENKDKENDALFLTSNVALNHKW